MTDDSQNERPVVEANKCDVCGQIAPTMDPEREDAWLHDHDCSGEPTVDEGRSDDDAYRWGTETRETLPVVK